MSIQHFIPCRQCGSFNLANINDQVTQRMYRTFIGDAECYFCSVECLGEFNQVSNNSWYFGRINWGDGKYPTVDPENTTKSYLL